MDIRQQYMDDGLGDIGRSGEGSMFFSSFNVLWEMMSVGMVQLVVELQTRSFSMASTIASRVVSEASVMNDRSWNNGFAIYLNDIVSGVSGRATASNASLIAEEEFQRTMMGMRRTFHEMGTDAASVSGGLMNAINGLVTTTTVMLHLTNPAIITREQAMSSTGAYASAMFSPTSPYALYGTGSNLVALVSRLGYVYRTGTVPALPAPPSASAIAGELEPPTRSLQIEDTPKKGGGGSRHHRNKRSRKKRKVNRNKKRTYRKK
jgi:hypothetical protein